MEFDDTLHLKGIGFAVPSKSQSRLYRSFTINNVRQIHNRVGWFGIEGNEQAYNGDCVRVGRAQIGEVTSGMIYQF